MVLDGASVLPGDPRLQLFGLGSRGARALPAWPWNLLWVLSFLEARARGYSWAHSWANKQLPCTPCAHGLELVCLWLPSPGHVGACVPECDSVCTCLSVLECVCF